MANITAFVHKKVIAGLRVNTTAYRVDLAEMDTDLRETAIRALSTLRRDLAVEKIAAKEFFFINAGEYRRFIKLVKEGV